MTATQLKPRIAAIVTEYRLLLARRCDHHQVSQRAADRPRAVARVEIASLYIDQFPENDLGRADGARYGVPIYPSIRQALTLGGDTLAVDGVLLIGEHGEYAWNEEEQHLYPEALLRADLWRDGYQRPCRSDLYRQTSLTIGTMPSG